MIYFCNKLIILSLFLSLKITNLNAQKQNNFILKGKIEGIKTGKIYLIIYNKNGGRILDSSKIEKGKFTFCGQVCGYSDIVYLKLNPKEFRNQDSLNSVQFEIDDSKMEINLKLNNFSKYQLIGCATCNERKNLYDRMENADSVYNLISTNKHSANNENNKIYDSLIQRNFDLKIDYIKNHPNSKLSPFLLYWNVESFSESEFGSFIKLFKSLNLSEQNSYYGYRCKITIEDYKEKVNQIGKTITDFTGVSLKGDTINRLTFKKNKILLLDFWASWCGPCRKGNPTLLKLYHLYHPLGLEIIGISDDSDREKWIKAIGEDQISEFTQLLFKEMNSPTWDNANGTYNLYYNSLPTRILIDSNGIILGRYDNASTDSLSNFIYNFFKEK